MYYELFLVSIVVIPWTVGFLVYRRADKIHGEEHDRAYISACIYVGRYTNTLFISPYTQVSVGKLQTGKYIKEVIEENGNFFQVHIKK